MGQREAGVPSGRPARTCRGPAIEGLEGRTLLSTAFVPAPGSPIPVGKYPFGVAVGDFTGNGKLDLAVANKFDNTVSILLGNGQGGFTPAPGGPIPVGIEPTEVKVADFNKDGKLDLAVANDRSNTVNILLGNGNGTFTPAPGSPIAVGQSATSIATGNFTADGNTDFAVTNVSDNTVSVYLGHGDGTFVQAPGSPYPSGQFPLIAATGDFTGNGRTDLVTSNFGVNTISLLMNNGNGTFTPSAAGPITVGTQPFGVAVGDFARNGVTDLAVANFGANTVSILLGDGHGAFIHAGTIPVGSKPVGITAGDFFGNGITDLAVANSGDNTVSILVGDGHGGFSPAPGGPIPAGIGPQVVTAADLTGTGAPDLIVGDSTGNTVTVLSNQVFVKAQGLPISAVEGAPVGNLQVAAATAKDPNASVVTASAIINWGDGTSPTNAAVTEDANKIFHIIGGHNYAEAGTFPVATAIQIGSTTIISKSTATVTDAALKASGQNFAAFSGQTSTHVLATFTDADPGGTVGDFTATINFGDGHTALGSIVSNGLGGFNVTGSNTYARTGNFPVNLLIQDAGGSSAPVAITAAVTTPLTATGKTVDATVGKEFKGVVATFTDAIPNLASAFTSTITFGDGHTAAGTIEANPSGGFNVVGANTYAKAGKFPISVRITDPSGNVVTATGSATVTAVKPPVVDLTGPTVVGLTRFGFHRNPTSIVLTFSKALDPARAGDVANYQLIAPAPDSGPRPGQVIPISSAVYDPANRTVTLFPTELINLYHLTRIQINSGAGGITDRAGHPLNQDKAGHAGGDYIAEFRGLGLGTSVTVLGQSNAAPATVPASVAHGHRATLRPAAVDALLASHNLNVSHVLKHRR